MWFTENHEYLTGFNIPPLLVCFCNMRGQNHILILILDSHDKWQMRGDGEGIFRGDDGRETKLSQK